MLTPHRTNSLLTILQANYLISIQAAAQLPLFLAVLPAINAWLLRIKVDAIAANRTLATGLAVCHIFGSVFMGLAPTASAFIYGTLNIYLHW